MAKLYRLAILLAVALTCLQTSAQRIRDNRFIYTQDSIQFSLLTCSPGDEIYEYYGHTALLLRDFTNPTELVINYGIFSFNKPGFAWRFMLGETDYTVGMDTLSHFLDIYRSRGSEVWEDVLNLDHDETLNLIRSLNEVREVGWTYRYNIFNDNCATRVRDKIENSVYGSVVYAEQSEEDSLKMPSLRSAVHKYSEPYRWSYFGQDLLLGETSDRPRVRRHMHFVPLELAADIRRATIHSAEGGTRPLVKRTECLVKAPANKVVESAFPLSPMAVALIILVVALATSIWDICRKRASWWMDLFLLLAQGLAGIIPTFLFFFSVHPTVGSNWLIVFLNPIPLLFLYHAIRAERRQRRTLYHLVACLWTALFLIASPFIPQYVSLELQLLALGLLMRMVTVNTLWQRHWRTAQSK